MSTSPDREAQDAATLSSAMSRRTALVGGSGALAAMLPIASPAQIATPAARPDANGPVVEREPSFRSMFPFSHYFEVKSKIAETRYGVWVTVPPGYEQAPADQRYPVAYQTDGNLFFMTTAPLHGGLTGELLSPLVPFIQVSVGYTEPEAHAWFWLRVRDFVPPGEVVPQSLATSVEVAAKAGHLQPEEADRYLAMFEKPAGDKFLGFLEKELHPLIGERFRIQSDQASLWGYSYGGVFSTYAALQRSPVFTRVGAASPGFLYKTSRIFDIYRQAIAEKRDYSGHEFHVTMNEREITQASLYRSIVAAGTTELLSMMVSAPLPGLKTSTEIVPHESHLSGGTPAWFSFLRSFFAANSP